MPGWLSPGRDGSLIGVSRFRPALNKKVSRMKISILIVLTFIVVWLVFVVTAVQMILTGNADAVWSFIAFLPEVALAVAAWYAAVAWKQQIREPAKIELARRALTVSYKIIREGERVKSWNLVKRNELIEVLEDINNNPGKELSNTLRPRGRNSEMDALIDEAHFIETEVRVVFGDEPATTILNLVMFFGFTLNAVDEINDRWERRNILSGQIVKRYLEPSEWNDLAYTVPERDKAMRSSLTSLKEQLGPALHG